MTCDIKASTLSVDEVIAAIALATELRPRDGRDAVARRIYAQIVKPLLDELEAKETEAEWMRKRIEELAKAREVSEERRVKWFQMAQKQGDDLDTAEKRNAGLTEFVQHVHKCLLKNGEYSPLSHEWIHTVLGISVSDRSDGNHYYHASATGPKIPPYQGGNDDTNR